MYKPCCENPVLLVNKYCLTMVQNGGTLYLNNVRYPAVPPLELLLEYARSGKFDFDECFVKCGDYSESFFLYVPCMKCDLCLHSKQVDLINRATLESLCWDCPPFFFCLTYNEKNLPKDLYGRVTAELCYPDVQKFFKRLRIRWSRKGLKHDIRYLVAGEYGYKFGRPHYHVILWNNPYKCHELEPYWCERLKEDIFHSWNKCDWNVFNDPNNFGQCRGGAARYATKYVCKPQLTHGHLTKPFIHCSAGKRGGLGSAYIDSIKDYLRDTPCLNYFDFVDKQGNYNYMFFSRSIQRRVYPSPSSTVPAGVRQLYRQLTDLTQLLYQFGYDFRTELDLLCPSKHIRNSFELPKSIGACSTFKFIFGRRLLKAFYELAELLFKVNDDDDYLKKYYEHKSFFVDNNVYDIAVKLSKIREKVALALDKTTF